MEYMPDENRPIRIRTTQYHEIVLTDRALNVLRCALGDFLEDQKDGGIWMGQDLNLLSSLHDDMTERHKRSKTEFLPKVDNS